MEHRMQKLCPWHTCTKEFIKNETEEDIVSGDRRMWITNCGWIMVSVLAYFQTK